MYQKWWWRTHVTISAMVQCAYWIGKLKTRRQWMLVSRAAWCSESYMRPRNTSSKKEMILVTNYALFISLCQLEQLWFLRLVELHMRSHDEPRWTHTDLIDTISHASMLSSDPNKPVETEILKIFEPNPYRQLAQTDSTCNRKNESATDTWYAPTGNTSASKVQRS
jgi:hypothetical protein